MNSEHHLARYDDESPVDHAEFLAWAREKPRGLPANRDLAVRYEWASRVALYDAQPGTSILLANPLESAGADLKSLLANEAAKLLKRSLDNPQFSVLTPREIIHLASLVAGRKVVDPSEEPAHTETWDLSTLSPEELKLLEKLSS